MNILVLITIIVLFYIILLLLPSFVAQLIITFKYNTYCNYCKQTDPKRFNSCHGRGFIPPMCSFSKSKFSEYLKLKWWEKKFL